MNSLYAAGHNITLVSPFPSETKKNYTTIDSRSNNTVVYIGRLTLQDMDMNVNEFMQFIINREMGYCYDIVKLPVIQVSLPKNT